MNNELKYYVDTNLKVQWHGKEFKLSGVANQSVVVYDQSSRFEPKIKDIKPIVRKLSRLTQPITVSGYNKGETFTPLDELRKRWSYIREEEGKICYYLDESAGVGIWFGDEDWSFGLNDNLPFWVTQLLCEWHFWIFDQEDFETNKVAELTL